MTERVEHSEATDEELVARCREGDETAFDALVLRHHARAVNVAFQLLRDRQDAAEVAQDAFVKVYRNIGEFRGECAFTTWLHQIVVNLTRNKHHWWTRRGRQATVSLDCPVEARARPEDAPDAEAARSEFVEALGRQMAELPAKFREALVLRNVEEMSYEEIAAAMRCSVGTVKSRVARAREALRERMKDELR